MVFSSCWTTRDGVRCRPLDNGLRHFVAQHMKERSEMNSDRVWRGRKETQPGTVQDELNQRKQRAHDGGRARGGEQSYITKIKTKSKARKQQENTQKPTPATKISISSQRTKKGAHRDGAGQGLIRAEHRRCGGEAVLHRHAVRHAQREAEHLVQPSLED